MRKDMIYDLRVLFLETYVRVTMIGYESKQYRSAFSRIAFNAVHSGEVKK